MTEKPAPGPDTAALYFADRLLDALSGMERFALTLSEARMGYGETVAARHWLGGRPAQRLGLCAWLLASGAPARHFSFAVHAHIYMAVACAAPGKAEEARAHLAEAPAAALPDTLHMPFVENRDLLKPCSKAMIRTRGHRRSQGPHSQQSAARIQTLAASREKNRRRMRAEHFPADGPRLTRRCRFGGLEDLPRQKPGKGRQHPREDRSSPSCRQQALASMRLSLACGAQARASDKNVPTTRF